ncbi:MAG: glycyl-radical enzyme activating protein [Eubacteriaceae bacterium]|jgi:pyruvate formate lyase activating enzyme|nr:glycyl-radical enzyme activating protein [Eubacteriaceae bacterium]
MVSGYVMQEQPFSVNDGEGIRTTIFLAGCPMRCRWCSNPEGFGQKPLVGYYVRQCIGCGRCAEVCPQGIGIDLNDPEARKKCTGCGRCAAACPKSARRQLVAVRDADEIIAAAKKFSMFYRTSGGGITFSGGEATFQPELLDHLSKKLYDMGFSLDLETCGQFDFDELKPALNRMDLIFIDIKHMDDEVHRKYTGMSNKTVLENICRLNDINAEIVVRVPVIGSVNDSDDNIMKTASYVQENLPRAEMELLPYHELGKAKYEALGMDPPDASFYTPAPEKMEHLNDLVRQAGVETVSFK